jgi:hypothetical protein
LPDNIEINSQEIADEVTPFIREALNLTITFDVVASVDNPKGMWPNLLGNSIMADMNDFYFTAYNTILDSIDE